VSAPRGNLAAVATSTLERLRSGFATGALPTPVDRAALTPSASRTSSSPGQALAGHQLPACLAILD
jgi:hypothetical protein